jgi:hypothetical protein
LGREVVEFVLGGCGVCLNVFWRVRGVGLV